MVSLSVLVGTLPHRSQHWHRFDPGWTAGCRAFVELWLSGALDACRLRDPPRVPDQKARDRAPRHVWYPTWVMRKTSVYLTEDEAEGLRRLAAREGRAQAELIREGVRRVIADIESEPRTFRSLGIGRGGGRKPGRWTADEVRAKAMGGR